MRAVVVVAIKKVVKETKELLVVIKKAFLLFYP